MTTIGFLHTSPVHVPVFRALIAELAAGVADVQVVDESLLADVRAHGYDASVEARLLARLHELDAHDPGVIVCTCSTLSGDAERLAERVGAPVLRIDRPLAERAVADGGRVAIVAAVESTLAPTRALFEDCAAAAGTGAVVVDAPCLDAWPLFERGDLVGFHDHIARHVRGLAHDIDVVVLAQASMAPPPRCSRTSRLPCSAARGSPCCAPSSSRRDRKRPTARSSRRRRGRGAASCRPAALAGHAHVECSGTRCRAVPCSHPGLCTRVRQVGRVGGGLSGRRGEPEQHSARRR